MKYSDTTNVRRCRAPSQYPLDTHPARYLLVVEAAKVAAYNLAIALLLTALTSGSFHDNLIYSQCVGLSIYAVVRTSCLIRHQDRPGWKDALIGIPLGFVLGLLLGSAISGANLLDNIASHPGLIQGAAATAFLFGAIATYHFHNLARLHEAQTLAREERLRRLEQEAGHTQTELALLQAQIEPHFLFNTLSNILSLIQHRPEDAQAMLLHLIRLLRTSLAQTRSGDVSLGEELALVKSYLEIMQIRMGQRLRWSIEADDDLLNLRLPPLLVQPLVENALRHGLEPKPDGGTLTLRCSRTSTQSSPDTPPAPPYLLNIEVADSGLGLPEAPGNGLGLSNVRRRLAACFGNLAQLNLRRNETGGVTALLQLPCTNQ